MNNISTKKNWKKMKLSWVFDEISSGTTPDSSSSEYYEGGEIPWVNTGDLPDGDLVQVNKTITKKAIADYPTLKTHPKNSLIIALYGATIGKLAITQFEVTTNQACCVLNKPKNINVKFIFYWFLAQREKIIQLSVGGGQKNISQGIIKSLRIDVPTLIEQKNIAYFLDRKTNEIDNLIADKEKLIELLEERRQSVISETVTKGLDSNVKMKDSGVEWIGEIPKDWKVNKLKHLFEVINGGTPKSQVAEYWEGNVLWITPEDLSRKDIYIINDSKRKITEVGRVSAGLKKVPPDSIVLSTRAPIGNIALTEKEVVTNQGCKSLVNRNQCDTNYFYYYLKAFSKVLNAFGKGTTFTELSSKDLKNISVPSPSLKEQKEISNVIKKITDELINIINELNNQVDLLKEYRQSLIYEAVTGKIDVQEMMNESEQEEVPSS